MCVKHKENKLRWYHERFVLWGITFFVGDNMEGAFREYANTFDMTDQRIKQKYNHSIRVMNLCEKYAKMLCFSDEEVYLAKVIGLLHDFGRFEQLKRFDSYSDKNIDHAVLGVNLLFDEFNNFMIELFYKRIIVKKI